MKRRDFFKFIGFSPLVRTPPVEDDFQDLIQNLEPGEIVILKGRSNPIPLPLEDEE